MTPTGADVVAPRPPPAMGSEDRLRLYREIFANSPDAIGVIGPDARYLEQNDAHRAMTGYTDEELRRLTPAVHLGEETFARVARGLAETGRFFGEVQSRTKDGRRLEIELSAFTVRDARGEVVCHVGIKRDVTQRRRAEEELRATRAQLAASEKLSALGSLVSGVAHEIRTPITYVATNVALALRRLEEADLSDAQREGIVRFLRDACEGVERVDHLVRSLRRFTQSPPGARTPGPLQPAIAQALDLFAVTHRDGPRVEADLGPAPQVPFDKVRIQQVVLNLLENAFDASPPGGVVRVSLRGADGEAEIRVRDEGPGLAPDVAARMWDPFFTTKPHGTGLGLSIVKRIVTEHGGSVRCEPVPGGGAEFVVRLPAAGAFGAPP